MIHLRVLNSLDLCFWSLRLETQEQVESIKTADCHPLVFGKISHFKNSAIWVVILSKINSNSKIYHYPFPCCWKPSESKHPTLFPRTSPHAFLTQHCDCGVTFLWRISVELAKISPFIRNWDICQRHSEFTARKIQQLKPAVLQSWETKHRVRDCEKDNGLSVFLTLVRKMSGD